MYLNEKVCLLEKVPKEILKMTDNFFFCNLCKALRAIHCESFSNILHLDSTGPVINGEKSKHNIQLFVLWIITIDKKEDKALTYKISNHKSHQLSSHEETGFDCWWSVSLLAQKQKFSLPVTWKCCGPCYQLCSWLWSFSDISAEKMAPTNLFSHFLDQGLCLW